MNIEIDFSEVDPKFLNLSEKEEKVDDEEEKPKMITIAGVSIVAEKLRGLIESDARQQEEKDKFYGDQQKTSQSETESENKKKSNGNEPTVEKPIITQNESSDMEGEEKKSKGNFFNLFRKLRDFFGKESRGR